MKIAIAPNISEKGTGRLNKFILTEMDKEADALIVRSQKVDRTDVLAIGRAGSGVNNIPVDKCTELGIPVFNTPGANANAVKELVLAGLFLSSRKIIGGVNFTKTIEEDIAKEVEKNKKQFAGNEIKGRTLGLVGFGKIGRLVAQAAHNLGMQVYAYDPFICPVDFNHTKATRVDYLEDIFSICDYVSLHLPSNEKTNKLINDNILFAVKRGCKILNFSRGSIVDNDVLKRYLEKGIISKYVTDFPCEELIGVDNVICIPHLGASTIEAEENCSIMICEQIKDYLVNGNIKNSVNFGNCSLDRSGTNRLCIINKDVPGVITKVTELISKNHMNIAGMVNKSKDGYAYNIIDLITSYNPEVLLWDELKKIEGIINFRTPM